MNLPDAKSTEWSQFADLIRIEMTKTDIVDNLS
jgi:hypothetical protein